MTGRRAFQHRCGDALRQWSRLLDFAEKPKEREIQEVNGSRHSPDDNDGAFRRLRADIAEDQAIDQEDPKDLLENWPEGADRTFDPSIHGRKNKMMMAPNIATTPPSLSGIERKMA